VKPTTRVVPVSGKSTADPDSAIIPDGLVFSKVLGVCPDEAAREKVEIADVNTIAVNEANK
jgi:hypothetical protein